MKSIKFRKNGFTLIELLVVITIIAALAGIVMTNFLGVRQRAKDSKKKAELNQIKSALRLYYNDYGKYPASSGSPSYLYFNGCGSAGTSSCDGTTCASAVFAAGGDGCSTATVYMKRFTDFDASTGYGFKYWRTADGDDYRLWVELENKSDPEGVTTVTNSSKCPTLVGPPALSSNSTYYFVCAD